MEENGKAAPGPEMICPQCKKPTITVSSFYECTNCGWKGLQPTFTGPDTSWYPSSAMRKYIPAVLGLMAADLSLSLIAAIRFHVPIAAVNLFGTILLAVSIPFLAYHSLNNTNAKWRIGMMSNVEIEATSDNDLTKILSKTQKMTIWSKWGNISAIAVLTGLSVIGAVFKVTPVLGFVLLILICMAAFFPFWKRTMRRLRGQETMIKNEISKRAKNGN